MPKLYLKNGLFLLKINVKYDNDLSYFLVKSKLIKLSLAIICC